MKNSIVISISKTTFIVVMLFFATAYTSKAQDAKTRNFIYLRSGKRIKIETIHKFDDRKVHYVKDGSLHDVLITEVDFIDWNNQIIRFNKFNKPIYPGFEKKVHSVEPETSEGTGQKEVTTENLTVVGNKNYGSSPTNRSTLFVRPLALLESFGKLYGGLNYRVDEGVYWKSGLGVMVHNWGRKNKLNYGFEYRTELKMVTSTQQYPNRFGETYFGVNGGYKLVSYDYWKYERIPDDQLTGDNYTYPWQFVNKGERKGMVGYFNLKVGRQTTYKNDVFIDVYSGLGARIGNDYESFDFRSRINFMLGMDIGMVL